MVTCDSDHIYRNKEREIYLSVTQNLTIAGYQDFSMVRREDLDHAALRGNYVHDACKLYAYDDLDVDSLDPGYRGYVDGFIKFCAEHDFEIHESEEIVYSDQLKTAGTFDVKGTLDNRLVVIDIKTGSTINHFLTGLQLAAYQNMIPGIVKPRRYCLHLKPNGTYMPWPYKDDEKDWYRFRSICRNNWAALAEGKIIPIGAKTDPKVWELCKTIINGKE